MWSLLRLPPWNKQSSSAQIIVLVTPLYVEY
jgi:hypothetical protein